MNTRSGGAARIDQAAVGPTLRLALALLMLLGSAVAACAQAAGAAPAAAPGPGLWDSIARLIVQPWATIALLVVGCLLLFIDLLTPLTWGLMGTLGAVAVALVFAAHLTVGTAGWIGITLFLAGLTFLLVETHIFPGQGIAAVIGLMLLFLGMFWALGGSQNAVFAVTVSTILTLVSLIGFFAYLPKSPVWKKLGQQMQQRASLGYVTADSQMHFLGRTGHAVTVLRPSGAAEIDGVRLDVVTEGEFLDPGTPVIVIRVEGGRIVVDDVQGNRADKEAAAAAAARDRSRVA
jgi:membrane-bound serine protease (ClpP class)